MNVNEYEKGRERLKPLFVEKEFSIKDTGLTYRVINAWSDKGLLDHFQNKDGNWHKFSFSELVEVLIYKELREVGFSIEKLKELKEFLNDDCGIKIFGIPQTILIVQLIQVLEGWNLFLTLNKTGCCGHAFAPDLTISEIVMGGKYDENESYGDGNSLIIVSLRKILDIVKVSYVKRRQEWGVLFDSLLDQKEGMKMEFQVGEDREILNLKETEYIQYDPSKKSIMDILKEEKNQNLTISTNSDGKITSIKRNKKIK